MRYKKWRDEIYKKEGEGGRKREDMEEKERRLEVQD